MASLLTAPFSATHQLLSLVLSLPHFLRRMYTMIRPPAPPKHADAIRLGLLGASTIAPLAVLNSARSHPEIIVSTVAARQRSRAETYAARHSIPHVHDSYETLLADPSVDAVYIPLPNGLHFEWALKALAAGKHVLLEKPSTSNAEEAKTLFRSALADSDLVLLEAFHYRFHPAFARFKQLLGSHRDVAHVFAGQWFPAGLMPLDDIRFVYDLAGGALMDFGTYPVSFVRHTLDAEPDECVAARFQPLPGQYGAKEPHVEVGVAASWRFDGGATADVEAEFESRGKGLTAWLPAFIATRLPSLKLPQLVATTAEREGPRVDGMREGERHLVVKVVTLWNPLMPTLWHRIDVDERHTIVGSGATRPRRTWHVRSSEKAYAPRSGPGEAWWPTYRYQLEEFVNRVKGRKGSGVWIEGEDSIKQMEMIDSAYRAAGLPPRPTSGFSIDML